VYRKLLQLARHSAVYGVGSIASKLLAILLLPVYVRFLEPADYGAAEAILMLDLFVVAIVKLGLQNSMMRFWHQEREHGRGDTVIRATVTTMVVTSLLGAGVLLAFARPLAGLYLEDASRYQFIWIAAFGVVCTTIYSTLTSIYRLQQRPATFLTVQLINIALSATFTLVFVIALDWNAAGLLLGNFMGTFAMIPVVGFMQRRYLVPSRGRGLLRPMLRFGLPTMPMAVANQGLTLIDRTVLAHVAGLTQVGLYALGSRFAQVVMLMVVALQMSWQPFAYSIKDDEEARRTYAEVMSWFVAGIGWLVVAASLLAEPVVRIITRPAYYDAAPVVPVLALAAGVYGVYFIAGIGALRVKKSGYHIVVAACALVTSLVANIVLVPMYGVMGAAVAALLANGVLSGTMVIRAQRVFPVPYQVGRIVRALVVILALVALPAVLSPTGAASWTIRCVLVAAYPALLVAMGFMPLREVRRLLHVARRRRGAATK
jgi:O-antigen/teichoic acid export membrane protein